MTVTNEKETRTDLGQIAEAGIHYPEPASAFLPRTRTRAR